MICAQTIGMRLHKATKELFVLSLSALLFVLLPMIFVLFKQEFRIWAITWNQFRVPFLTVLGCAFFFIGLLLRFPSWARRWFLACAIIWFVYCFVEIQKTPFASLIVFFILSHSILWLIYHELTQYIFLPHIRLGVDWFFGPQKLVPGLHADFEYAEEKVPMNVSSISYDGMALFIEDPKWDIPDTKDQRVNIFFRNRSLRVHAEIIASYVDKKGLKSTLLGLKFKVLNPDDEKDLSDFLEKLRGEGHEF